ncbi:prepilin-type N-terminal cleavage/methylation domain-containing protein [Pseudoalteromonas haloplanktis]|uniref:Prepilin-type N-terminal cleavage/methylation domain-containing protein n=1 Tax=Pseudoalteromonas haloplanktis TaxID=228 RepID=A0ABU1BEW2_PSEHA|nr:prepilin-type N-terminal cleavage/methylation domain-containing protein [Pseudoalteromonas haloplanktis]MDQ9092142.1 prepilin-type N-terminal cleavage/methylation domain-containing protein [Pseudoalteromonas haloplanktis]
MNRQRGVSLISLLIGLLISSIVLIGMMMIFRNTIQTIVPASESSRSDGERMSALLSAHMLLQDGGFGIENAIYDTHLKVLNNDTLVPLDIPSGSTATGNTIVWLSSIAGNIQCNGLRADTSGGLWRVSCNTTLGDITPTARLILPSQYTDDGVAPITITATRAPCWPFGIGVEGNIMITLVLQNSTEHLIDSSTCLVNFG